MSKRAGKYLIQLSVDMFGEIEVKIKDINTGKEIFIDNSYTFERLYEKYLEAKKMFLEVEELRKLIERIHHL